MKLVRIGQKGQVTIPAEIRDALVRQGRVSPGFEDMDELFVWLQANPITPHPK